METMRELVVLGGVLLSQCRGDAWRDSGIDVQRLDGFGEDSTYIAEVGCCADNEGGEFKVDGAFPILCSRGGICLIFEG